MDDRTYKNDETSLVVLKNTYDVTVVKGAKTKIIDAVDCTLDTCLVDNIVSTMTVKFPGISGVHTYVKVNDNVAGTATGGAVDDRTYKNDETSLVVLKNTTMLPSSKVQRPRSSMRLTVPGLPVK